MKEHEVPVQSLIDHIKTAVDVDPWAKEMAEELLKEQEAKAKWIYCEDEYGQDGYKCSECGFFVPWLYDFETINFINDYKVCPSCRKTIENSAGGEADEH